MTIETAVLNDSANLPNDTGPSQAPAVKDSTTPPAEDLQRGYSKCGVQRIPMFDAQIAGGENEVGDLFTYGGFLGRPQGNQR